MLNLTSLEDQAEEGTQLLANENSPGEETAREVNEPTWLHDPTSDPSEDQSVAAEPSWLHRLELADTSAPPSSLPETSLAFESPDLPPQDEFASAMRSRLRVGELVAGEASPDLASSAPPQSLFGRVQHGLKRHGLLVAISVIAVIPLLCAVGWFGVASGVLFAAPGSTLMPEKLMPVAELAWPATWTPLPKATATQTARPTNTATSTQTLKPTRVPPTRTPRPPSPTVSPFLFNSVQRGCQHSGGTFIEGVVSSIFGEVTGAHVSLGGSPGGNVIQTVVTGKDKSSGYYTFVIRAEGAYPGTFYVWVTDTAGNALSDPNAGRVVTNSIRSSDDPAACWQAFVDFNAVR